SALRFRRDAGRIWNRWKIVLLRLGELWGLYDVRRRIATVGHTAPTRTLQKLVRTGRRQGRNRVWCRPTRRPRRWSCLVASNGPAAGMLAAGPRQAHIGPGCAG